MRLPGCQVAGGVLLALVVAGCADPAPFEVPPGSQRNAAGMWMTQVPAGDFRMGSPDHEFDRFTDEPVRPVSLTRPLWVALTEVTQGQWGAVMGKADSEFQGRNRPVDQITWFEAVAFCNRLSEREGLGAVYEVRGNEVSWDGSGAGYRLPTEAEWEYFARAGVEGPFSTGKLLRDLDANVQAAYPYGAGAEPGSFRGETTPVAAFAPNAWGIYDIHGNVWEWCWDWYGGYGDGATVDPRGPERGHSRVIRGGSWYHFPVYARFASRGRAAPDLQGNPFLGFRPVRFADEE